MKTLIRPFCLLLALAYLAGPSALAHGSSRRPGNISSSYPLEVVAGWNLLSLPANVADGAKDILFPTSSSKAFIYDNTYIPKDTLESGSGFWLKFDSPQTIAFEGDTVFDKAIAVKAGWNLIGSLSVPMPVKLIYSEPDSNVSSVYYGLAAGGNYQRTDTLQPGMGYWVQVKQDGTLFLTAPGNTEGPISDSARSIVLDSINAFVNRLPHVDDDADNLTLRDYLRSIPLLEASDTLLGSVWARFIDGRMFIRANDLHATGGSMEYPQKEIPKSREPEQVASPTDNLPGSSQVWICNALGSFFDNPAILPGGGVTETVDELRQWHTMTGYTLASNGGATVGDLKNISNVAVFYISAHGGTGKDRNNNVRYAVWTSTEREPLFDAVLRRDLNDGTLVYFSCPDIDNGRGGSIEKIHYAFTSDFIEKYMDFQNGAAVFMNACGSYYQDHFAKACQAKGAGFYVGWTGAVAGGVALRAARHFFDRMLGTNQYFPENPPQRPFDADLVWNDLILKGYDISPQPKYTTMFKIDPEIPEVNLLAPSILQTYKDPIPGSDNFYIDGLFGQDPRPDVTVNVGNATLNIIGWDSTKLTLNPPTQGGNVQVTIRGRKSNVTQYTQWHAVIQYTLLGRGTLKKHVTFNVDFLADVHKFRINIADPPIFGPGPRFIQVLNTSSASYECSGEYTDPDNPDIIETWAGAGTIPLGPDFTFSSVLYDIGSQSTMFLTFSAPYTNTGAASTFGIEYGLENFSTMMNSNYTLIAGFQSGGDGTNTAELTWGDMTPLYPPDPTGAR